MRHSARGSRVETGPNDCHAGGNGIVREKVKRIGLYAVPYLPVGTYDVTATLAGFTGGRVTNVTIRVGLTATVDLSLKAAPVRTEFTVNAHATHLELQSAARESCHPGGRSSSCPSWVVIPIRS
jgi:hypothetical protein